MSDAGYILALNLVLGFVILGAFAGAWFHDRSRTHYLWYVVSFAAGLSCGILEMLLPHLDGALWARFAIYLSFSGCLTLMLVGVARQYDVPVSMRMLAAIFVAGALCNIPTLFMERNSVARMVLYQVPFLVLCLISATVVWRSQSRRIGDWALMVLIGMFSLHFASRPVVALMLGGMGPEASSYLGTFYAVTTQFSVAILTIAIAVVLLGLAVADTVSALHDQTRRDPLTGISNRLGFEQAVRDRMSGDRTTVPYCFVACDLDNFKSVNDTYGHSAGDAVIKAFAETLSRSIRSSDICGRVGGEEFCVLLSNVDVATGKMFMESVRLAFASRPVSGLPDDQRFTASFGLTEISHVDDLEKGYARADRALYSAKRGGRNKVEAALHVVRGPAPMEESGRRIKAG